MKKRKSGQAKSRRNGLLLSHLLQKLVHRVPARNIVALSLMLGLSSIASLAHASTIQLIDANGTFISSWNGISQTMNGAGMTSALTMYGAGAGFSAVMMTGGSGNDQFLAGVGSDTFTGGPGPDLFAFGVAASNAASHYRISDFTANDSLYVGGTYTAAQLLATATISAAGVTLNLSNGATVTVSNLTSTDPLNGRIRADSSLSSVAGGPPAAVTATGYTVFGTPAGALTTPVGDTILGELNSALTVSGQSVSGLAISADGSDGFSVVTAAGDGLSGKAGSVTITSSAGSVTLVGTTNNQTLVAGANTHSITGGAGNDTLIAGAGNDTLTGGPGIDTLTGGLGANRFVDTAANLNLDTITDLSLDDQIVITGVRFSALHYNSTTGVLQLDTSGNGSFATSINLSPGLVGDFLAIPSAASDNIFTTVVLLPVPEAPVWLMMLVGLGVLNRFTRRSPP